MAPVSEASGFNWDLLVGGLIGLAGPILTSYIRGRLDLRKSQEARITEREQKLWEQKIEAFPKVISDILKTAGGGLVDGAEFLQQCAKSSLLVSDVDMVKRFDGIRAIMREFQLLTKKYANEEGIGDFADFTIKEIDEFVGRHADLKVFRESFNKSGYELIEDLQKELRKG